MSGRSAPGHFGTLVVRPPLALPGQRIGVMGGSFNPPHEGHLIVARTALRRLKLDQLWWVVTPGNPLKAHNGLPLLEERIAACRKLAGSDPRMKSDRLSRRSSAAPTRPSRCAFSSGGCRA